MKITPAMLLVLLVTVGVLVGCNGEGQTATVLCANCRSVCDAPEVPGEDVCAASAGPVIDDQALRKKLQAAAQKLMDDKKATAIDVLTKQMKRTRCKITPPALRDEVITPAQTYARCKSAVIVVAGTYKCTKCTKWHTGGASGVLIDPSGVFVTNYHVMASKKNKAMVAMTSDGQVYPVIEVLAASEADDLAIVRLDAGGKQLTALPVQAHAPVGATATVISHPKSHHYTLTAGIVSRYQKTKRANKTVPMMTITADFAMGSSGAPILDEHGSIIGLVSSTSSVYYPARSGKKEQLQMVFKQCVPGASILKLISGK